MFADLIRARCRNPRVVMTEKWGPLLEPHQLLSQQIQDLTKLRTPGILVACGLLEAMVRMVPMEVAVRAIQQQLEGFRFETTVALTVMVGYEDATWVRFLHSVDKQLAAGNTRKTGRIRVMPERPLRTIVDVSLPADATVAPQHDMVKEMAWLQTCVDTLSRSTLDHYTPLDPPWVH